MTISITHTLPIDERELEERFVRASGSGGTKRQQGGHRGRAALRRGGSSLPHDVKMRLAALAGSRMTSDGVLLIDSREYRTQAMNREAARERLVAMIQQAAIRPRRRTATRPGRAAKERRIIGKKQRAGVKSGRGRPRGSED